MRLKARLAVCGLLAVLAGLSSSCTSIRSDLGNRPSICFAALPVARQVVGQSPSFAGVRYLSPRFLGRSLERLVGSGPVLPTSLSRYGGRPMCLVGYEGSPPPGSKQTAWHAGPPPYGFTVVVVHQSDDRVLGVVLVGRAPFRFAQLS